MAGPCSVETRDQLGRTARAVQASGARVLRGGAFKPRTSPYSFQGHGEDGAAVDARRGGRAGRRGRQRGDGRAHHRDDAALRRLPAGRRPQHAELRPAASELGRVRKPVLLKRGMSATIEEWLLSAEYVLAGRQQPGDPVRARHPHLRERDPQHARHLGHPGGEEAQPPADPGRPQPRHRPARQGDPHGARGHRRRRRRPADRGPPRPGQGALRRRAEPVPRSSSTA